MEHITNLVCDPTKLALYLFLGILFVLIFLVPIRSQANHNDLTTIEQIEDVERYIKGFVVNRRDHRYRNARETAKEIVSTARALQIDYRILCITIKCESSFYRKVSDGRIIAHDGKIKGEKGMGQLHGKALRYAKRKGANVKTWQGQILGSGYWIQFCKQNCGDDLYKTFAGYISGKCIARFFGAGYRTRLYKNWDKVSR